MVALDDTVGAFVPGPRCERPPLGSGRLSGLGFAVKDLFDVAGALTTYGNPDWASTHSPAAATAPVVTACCRRAPGWSARPRPWNSPTA